MLIQDLTKILVYTCHYMNSYRKRHLLDLLEAFDVFEGVSRISHEKIKEIHFFQIKFMSNPWSVTSHSDVPIFLLIELRNFNLRFVIVQTNVRRHKRIFYSTSTH